MVQLPLPWSGWSALTLLMAIMAVYSENQPQASVPSSEYYVISSSKSRPSWCVSSVTCHTLDEYIIDGTLNTSYANFVFLNGTHQLNQSLMVYDSTSLTLRGSVEMNSTVQVVCASRWIIALSFTRVSSLTIQNINFINCSYKNSFAGPKKTDYWHAVSALHFESGSDLTLSGVKIFNGGFSIINTQGRIEITRMSVTSNFYEKAGSKNFNQSFGGSYFYYFSADCSSRIYLTIFESTFQFHNKHFLVPPVSKKDKFGSSGLCVIVSCTNLQITIRKTTFLGYRSGEDGGNMMVSLKRSQYIPSYSYILTISECHIEGGDAVEGGGVFISAVQPSLSNKLKKLAIINITKLKIFNISNTVFINNTAREGGGLIAKLKKFSGDPTVGYIQIEQCTFERNHLKRNGFFGGLAVHINAFHEKPSIYHTSPGFSITFKNCLVRENYFDDDKTCSAANGVVTLVKVLHFHIENSTFLENYCTAIKAIASNLVLEGQVNFASNSGSSGGGLLLCDDSVMILKPNTQVRIVNNNVQHTGGGITVESQCLQSQPICFFQLSDEITHNSSLLDTVEIEIFNNSAKYAGYNIYGGSIDNCYLVHPPQYYRNKKIKSITEFVLKKIFRNLTITNSSVTSIARRICFCDNGEKNCTKESNSVEVFPGEHFEVPVVPIGMLNGTVPASVRAHPYWHSPNHRLTINPNEMIQNIRKSKCTSLNYTVKSSNYQNDSDKFIELNVQHEGDISGYIRTNLYKAAKIYIKLKPCPVGFSLIEGCEDKSFSEGCQCMCDPALPTSVHCCIISKTVKRPLSLWIGYIRDPYTNNQTSQKYLTYSRCIFDFCSSNLTIISTQKNIAQDTQCQFNRTGILCGACGQNLSAILGSSECWSCQHKSLLLLLLFALIGISLIMFLTVCNLTISGGEMSGLIFYANIVHINDTISIPAKSKAFSLVLKTIIAWINLDLGIHTCFYNGMDAYAKAWLQFAFPLYLWLLSGLIVFLCNRYISVTRLFRTNSVRVLATVILLSFTKLLRAVITTFSCVNLTLHINKTNHSRILWASNPNVPCLQGKHIPLFVFGVIFSVVWLVFIIFMLFIQCWPRLRCCSWIQRLKPFTDSFTGSNTSQARFWTGLLLLSRLVIAVVYSVYENGENRQNYFNLVAITLVGLLLVSVIIPSGIFIKHSNNCLETFFLLNLLFILLNKSANWRYVLISLSLIAFSGILIYHCWTQVKHTRFGSLVQAKICKLKAIFVFKNNVTAGSAYPAYCTFDQDREPLLAN